MFGSLQFASNNACYMFVSSELLLDESADDLQLAGASVDNHRQTVELDCVSSIHVAVHWHLLPSVPAVVVRKRPASISHDLSAKPRPSIGISLV